LGAADNSVTARAAAAIPFRRINRVGGGVLLESKAAEEK